MTTTKPKTITLRPHELARLDSAGSVCVVRVAKRQPVPARDIFGSPAATTTDLAWPVKGGFYAINDSARGLSDILDTCPFGRVGDVVAIRGTDQHATLARVDARRVQTVTEAEAENTGAKPYHCPQADALMNAVGGGMKPIPYTSGFANLWNEHNGKKSPWWNNDWCWIGTFTRSDK